MPLATPMPSVCVAGTRAGADIADVGGKAGTPTLEMVSMSSASNGEEGSRVAAQPHGTDVKFSGNDDVVASAREAPDHPSTDLLSFSCLPVGGSLSLSLSDTLKLLFFFFFWGGVVREGKICSGGVTPQNHWLSQAGAGILDC